jgi:antitoxin component YwqK of YwqJK toxin-antitoxin module
VDGELDGPYESYSFASYYENGQLFRMGTYNMGEECGEWIEDGETVTYPPCPPGLADGN